MCDLPTPPTPPTQRGPRTAARGASLAALVTLATALPRAQDPAPVRQVTVPLHGGWVEGEDLARALLQEYELDAEAIALPHFRVDLRGPRGLWVLTGARLLLLRTVRFRRDLERQQLELTIDREQTRRVRRELRARLSRLVARLAGEEVRSRRYELELPLDLDRGRPLAVLVHGIESDASIWDDLRDYLARQQPAPQLALFSYPNDESIERVAAELARRLRELGVEPLVLIGHSMGGVVARAVVEDPALDPGTVRALILLGAPNGGSNLAGFRFALEAADVLRQVDGEQALGRELLAAMLDHLRDGLGEAGGDLQPESVFAQRLAARGRNPRVDYHVVLGTRSVLTEATRQRLREALGEALERSRAGRLVQPRLQSWVADLDELVLGRGDGAVSVARGQLDGVEPVLVPLDHLGLVRLRGLLGRIERGEDHPVFTKVALWLAER